MLQASKKNKTKSKYLSMSNINWLAAFNRLFEMINSDGDAYHSGPAFLKTIMPVNYIIPNYNQLIEERRKLGKSTSRKDFFYDLLMSLNEGKRIKAYQIFIEKLKNDFPDKVEGLKNELKKISENLTTPQPVVQIAVPSNLWNADKLNDYIEKMDRAITEKDYNRTLTLAYSCLEGLYKAFVKKNIAGKSDLDEVNPLAKEVKNYIKNQLDSEGKDYPENIIALIGTVTNAISNARNKFSESHFNSEADEWLAEYARDNVNSIARLVLRFI